MDFSLFLTIVAAAIGFFVIRRFRFNPENNEIDTSSLSPSSPPSSLSSRSLSTSSTPSALSPSSASPSSSSHVWMYDVFPSFRGEDVRRDVLSHILKEFTRKGITPFNDNGIKRGESIGPKLIQGIRESKIAIILLSRNYASSTWCLEELVEIMKCREELGQTVMAIFYKVDPSDVKKLTGDFGSVFRKTCEGKGEEDIGRWKQALEKVATIAGYHSYNWDNEASMVETIASDVSNELFNFVPSRDFEVFVGMRAHMINLKPLLLLGTNEVRMIGIWGPSGIGKSTIARVLFNQHSHQFPFSVFMEKIKRRYRGPYIDTYSAQIQLQEEFLSKLINQKDIKIHRLEVVQDRLKGKKVLVVLDDVDHLLQLEAVAEKAQWFGPGSIIVITTQDKKLLTAHEVKYIYEVELPPDKEALEIFCRYAFGQKYPPDGFKELAWEVTKLAGKLPLGLRVMGSHFKGRPKQEWQEELPRLRSRLDGEIESTLKFSYDALCDDNQAIFLHLACFLKDELPETVERCLEKNFVGVKGCLRVLAEKSFIYFEWGRIKMHDLLALLGREIVRKKSIHEPGQRQFLVDAGDICQVLRDGTLVKFGYTPHSRRTATKDIIKMYVEKKDALKKWFLCSNQRVSLTTDIWVSPTTGASYMVITVHYIDASWRLKKLIIGFKHITDHKGQTIANVLLECLSEWGIINVFCITVDNATANSSALRKFQSSFALGSDQAFVLDGEFLHMRCSAHIINLIVRDGMAEIDQNVVSIRNAISYVRSHTNRLRSFELKVDSGKITRGSLPLDVKTRWNSTYLMLTTSLKFKVAFDKMEAEDKLYNDHFSEFENGEKRVGPPQLRDWNAVEKLCRFLLIFYNSTLVVSASTSLNSHRCYGEIVTIATNLVGLSSSSDSEMRSKATEMLKKFEKYWNGMKNINMMLIVATVFDPSNKLELAKMCFEELYGLDTTDYKEMYESLMCLLRSLFKEYSSRHGARVDPGEQSSQSDHSTQPRDQSVERMELVDDFVGYKRMDVRYKQKLNEIGVREKKDELETYLKESVEHPDLMIGTEYDVLSWWRKNSVKYPVLSEIARDVLALQVSSVASESAFSTSGRLLEPHRSCLTHYMVEVLMCTEQWMKQDIKMEARVLSNPQILAELEEVDKLEREYGDTIVPEED